MLTPPPVFIDIEASGFGAGSYPIEVGYILPDGQAFCRLITPAADWTHWDAGAEAMHGISRATLLTHGSHIEEVAALLNQALYGKTVYTDAWSYDIAWLDRLFDAAERVQLFRLDDLRTLLSESQISTWDDTKQQVISELNMQRHRASSDARILQLTFLRVTGRPVCVP